MESDTFVRAFEEALDVRGVPYAHVGGEDRDISLDGARWIICATSGGLNPELFTRFEERPRGALISLGPRAPIFDGAFRPLASPYDLDRLRGVGQHLPALVQDGPAAANAAVARAIEALGLPAFASDPDTVFATVHEDASGALRILFLLNPGEADVVARVALNVARATDVLEETSFEAQRGVLEVRLMRHTVRMLALG